MQISGRPGVARVVDLANSLDLFGKVGRWRVKGAGVFFWKMVPIMENPLVASQRMSRRQLLWSLGGGLGGIALVDLLGREGLLGDEGPLPHGRGSVGGAREAADARRAELNGGLHHPARA